MRPMKQGIVILRRLEIVISWKRWAYMGSRQTFPYEGGHEAGHDMPEQWQGVQLQFLYLGGPTMPPQPVVWGLMIKDFSRRWAGALTLSNWPHISKTPAQAPLLDPFWLDGPSKCRSPYPKSTSANPRSPLSSSSSTCVPQIITSLQRKMMLTNHGQLKPQPIFCRGRHLGHTPPRWFQFSHQFVQCQLERISCRRVQHVSIID
jgi:hypothetical protein